MHSPLAANWNKQKSLIQLRSLAKPVDMNGFTGCSELCKILWTCKEHWLFFASQFDTNQPFCYFFNSTRVFVWLILSSDHVWAFAPKQLHSKMNSNTYHQ